MPTPSEPQGTCFVVMGFGKKTDFETGRVLDLDQSYKNLIKPAVEAAGLKCIRADEIVHSGLIDVPMYELLLKADIVVADLSTSNRNAFYELGVRHALRPFTTVIVAEEQMMKAAPFDVNHIAIQSYRHLGEDIGVSEAKRFTQALTQAIEQIMATKPELRVDSPVYRFISRLTPPSIAEELKQAVAAAASEPVASVTGSSSSEGAFAPAHSAMMKRVDEAQKNKDWLKAKILLEEVREMRKAKPPETGATPQAEKPEDPYIIQRLALATYKSEHPSAEEALKQACDLLSLLEPETSNDTETLGLWGAAHKRRWELTKDETYLDRAVRAYERGFYLRNDYYNGINYAYLLNVRAVQAADLPEAIADFVQARRVRQEVLEICDKALAESAAAGAPKEYWILATIAEAHIGLEDGQGDQKLAEAFAVASEKWMKDSTQEQVDKLKALLADSPLKKISGLG